MLIVTAKQLFKSYPALAAISSQRIKGPRLAYTLGKIWKQAQVEMESLQKTEREVFERFGGESITLENGTEAVSVNVEEMSIETRAEFDAAIKELHETAIEVWGSAITLDQLEAAAVALSADDFAALDWLMADEPIAEQAKGKGA